MVRPQPSSPLFPYTTLFRSSLAIMLVVIVVGVFVLDYFVNREADAAAAGEADYTVAVDASVSELEPQLTQTGEALGTSLEIVVLSRAEAEARPAAGGDASGGGGAGRTGEVGGGRVYRTASCI